MSIMKKLFSVLFLFLFINMSVMPVYANSDDNKKSVVDTVFVTDLNLDKSVKGQIVQFKTKEGYTDSSGITIPEGTIINGEIASLKTGRWAYRRAKARIVLHEMTLPDGSTYKIKGRTKRKVLKGSAIGNVCKGIITFPAVLVVGAGGTCVMIIECVSIVGIILLVPTAMLIGGTCGKLSNGVNYKKQAGDSIKVIYCLKQ